MIITRFLDGLIENTNMRIFYTEKKKTIFNPYSNLLTEELVEEALKEDLQRDVNFIGVEVRPMTSKGDNYATIVVAVVVCNIYI